MSIALGAIKPRVVRGRHWQTGVRVFKTRPFARFAARENIGDKALREAADRASKGLVDADLGGGVVKQRIARPGEGRSGGVRAILLWRRGELAFFAYGFAKSDRANLRPDELRALRRLADEMLALDGPAQDAMLANGTIDEVE